MAFDLKQLQSLLDSAQSADQFKKDVQRALKKVGTNLNALQSSLDEANALLSEDYAPEAKERKTRAAKAPKELGVEPDPEAPYGRKADGTPKSKPGRSKAVAE
jgi:ABC-type transporter Mla subunit MlaD